ncbi:hypothetical protein KIW84_034609 [Lathyrus oleraceus]|uniref:Uncharacterized protein n=1 Tax=Pisum sativum TaxID=3888 RepID=A0A9D4XZU9_PEA|nr:hypothetical protein KIW84_034609 [Pisum sativum]
MIVYFNSGLKQFVQNFNGGQLPRSKFVYLEFYQSSEDLATNGKSYGFDIVDKGCCGVGKNNGQITLEFDDVVPQVYTTLLNLGFASCPPAVGIIPVQCRCRNFATMVLGMLLVYAYGLDMVVNGQMQVEYGSFGGIWCNVLA